MEQVKDVSLGLNHEVVLKQGGSVWTLGNNEWGQLGIGAWQGVPTKIVDDLAIDASNTYRLFAKSDRSLWAWVIDDSTKISDGL